MAKEILKNQRIFLGGYEFTTISNSVKMSFTRETPDATTFGSSAKKRIPGLKDASIGIGGFVDYGITGSLLGHDQSLYDGLVSAYGDLLMSIIPQSPIAGGTAFFANAQYSSLDQLGKVGEVQPFSLAGAGDGGAYRGKMMVIPTTDITATGSSAVYNDTTAAVGKKIRIALHVTSITGTTPTIAFVLNSSAVVGMTSPTVLATFTSMNAIGTQYFEVILANTNAYFQLAYTVTGTLPHITALATFSIL